MHSMKSSLIPLLFVLHLPGPLLPAVRAQGIFDYERAPINYHKQPAANAITRLQEKIDAGSVKLEFRGPRGYLDSFLKHLDIPVSTQALVFSKSSVQLRLISPSHPRALYFKENLYVGWVQGGGVLEIIAADPMLGSVFYTLKQREVKRPRLVRDKGQCLQCHGASRTKDVPGPMVRSLYTGSDGQPIFNFGFFVSDHDSPFFERWGGYYVTGTHGAMRHMGNMLAEREGGLREVDYKAGANVTDLGKLVNTRPYPSRHSDIVALMVLEHQSQMQNLITRARYQEIRGDYYDKALDPGQGFRSELTRRLVRRAGEALLRYMLFADEFQLTSPVKGTSGFAEEFSGKGPHDKRGRSLYELDLDKRLFKYPLSYMIYTQGFRQLPAMTAAYVSRRLGAVLTAKEVGDEFPKLGLESRKAILEILRDTLPEFTRTWQ